MRAEGEWDASSYFELCTAKITNRFSLYMAVVLYCVHLVGNDMQFLRCEYTS